MEAELFHADRLTEGQDEANSRFSRLCERALKFYRKKQWRGPLTKLMVTMRSCCWCRWPFFVFLPPLTDAAFGWVFTCPFCAVGGFWAGFWAAFVCPLFWIATGVFWPACPFWLTWPPPSAGLLRAWKTTNATGYVIVLFDVGGGAKCIEMSTWLLFRMFDKMKFNTV